MAIEVMKVIAESRYNYYAEKIARVVMEHDLIQPNEVHSFTSFIRGY